MLSRVADSLYWMSRYLERAEHTVRMLDVNMGLMLDKSSTSAEGRWKRVLAALGNPQGVSWQNDYYQLVHSLTFDADIPASVTSCLIEARENARQVRDEISSEQWQQLNRMYHWVIQPHSEYGLNTRLADFLPAVIDGVHLFQGVTDTTMSHGEEWQFIQMGRYLERAAATANLLDLYQPEILSTPEVAAEGLPIPGVGGLAALLHGLRSVLQGLYRGPYCGPDSRISAAEPAVSAFAQVFGRLPAPGAGRRATVERKAAGG